MSYRKPDTGNNMNNLFTSLTDFVIIAPNLINAKTPESFEIWLDKLTQIDKRALMLYLEQHNHEIPDEYMKIANKRLQSITSMRTIKPKY